MALQSIGNQSLSTSIFRPTPTNTLQSNLAQFYERTSEFVEKQFQELSEGEEAGSSKRRIQNRSDEDDMNRPRLQPKGMGTMVDIFV